MNKIQSVYEILKSNIPIKYVKPIRIYKNTTYLLKAYCKINKEDYKTTTEFYVNYLNKHRKDYIDFDDCSRKKVTRKNLTIAGLATNPISLNQSILLKRKRESIAFVILHEFGHFIYKNDERKCDLFAKEWVEKLKRKKIL